MRVFRKLQSSEERHQALNPRAVTPAYDFMRLIFSTCDKESRPSCSAPMSTMKIGNMGLHSCYIATARQEYLGDETYSQMAALIHRRPCPSFSGTRYYSSFYWPPFNWTMLLEMLGTFLSYAPEKPSLTKAAPTTSAKISAVSERTVQAVDATN